MTATTPAITITVDDDSDLARALDAKSRNPIVLVRGETRYLVTPEDPWTNYDTERLRESLRKVAGTFTEEEGERIKEMIYRSREEGSRAPSAP